MIRQVEDADRSELLRMRTLLWPDSSESEVDDVLRRVGGDVFVVVVTRPSAGLCAFAEIASRRIAEGCVTSPVGYVEGIWVDHDQRRCGYGLQMMHWAADWARSRGFSEMASDCDVANGDSEALHGAAGFVKVGRTICFRRDL